MNRVLRYASMLLPLLVAACSTPPTSYERAMADYGAVPSDHEAIIKQHMRSILKDPDSAQYEFFAGPRKITKGSVLGGATYGYAVCVRINSRNSFGGYTGYRPNLFFMRDGRILDAQLGDGVYFDAGIEKSCAQF